MEQCKFHSGIEVEIKALNTKMDEREKLADIKINAVEKSISVAKEDMERRLEAMNEFRSQLTSQATTFISRTEFKLENEKLVNRILPLEKGLTYREGSKHWSDYIITTVVSAIVFLILHFIFKF